MPDQIEDFSEPTPEAAKLRRFDLRGLWRLTFWGAAAALAVVVVAGTAFSDVGAERVKQALASVLEQAKPVVAQVAPVEQPRTVELEKQTQQLIQQAQQQQQQVQQVQKEAQQLRDTLKQLTADRDQLKGRIAILEQSLDDITGAIKRQAAQATPQAPKEPVAASAPPPAISPPPTVAAANPDPPAAATADTATPPQVAATPQVPMPTRRVAVLAPPASSQPAEPLRKELGVDLGGAANLDQLRAHWATIKANIGPDLVGMHASYMLRTKTSGAIEYRLVVGTFPTSTDAIKLCTKLTPMRMTCRAGTFNVQHLAER